MNLYNSAMPNALRNLFVLSETGQVDKSHSIRVFNTLYGLIAELEKALFGHDIAME